MATLLTTDHDTCRTIHNLTSSCCLKQCCLPLLIPGAENIYISVSVWLYDCERFVSLLNKDHLLIKVFSSPVYAVARPLRRFPVGTTHPLLPAWSPL